MNILDQIALIDMVLSPCQHPSDNHSKDRITVWHGSTTPLILCGYHESQGVNNALKLIRKEPTK